uniref:Coiled-coil domain containing 84 n=1 Tax=Knipowitschia caucasica TaxID=637954 RepID=A0AAV2MP43_KNICA
MKHCWPFLNQQQHSSESQNPEEPVRPAGDRSSGGVSEESRPQTSSRSLEPPPDVPYSAAGLTYIGNQNSDAGNVHTGALPPWLQQDEDPLEGGSGSASAPQQEQGPSLQGFLKHKEQEKLKKLPPNRVGANFDHGSHTDANWLPSFGRVWETGRRWQSRGQFRREEEQKKRRSRRRDRRGGGGAEEQDGGQH